MNDATNVIFRAKSEWQKDDCLFCSSSATIEAVTGKAAIRCCEKEECKKAAERVAKESGQF